MPLAVAVLGTLGATALALAAPALFWPLAVLAVAVPLVPAVLAGRPPGEPASPGLGGRYLLALYEQLCRLGTLVLVAVALAVMAGAGLGGLAALLFGFLSLLFGLQQLGLELGRPLPVAEGRMLLVACGASAAVSLVSFGLAVFGRRLGERAADAYFTGVRAGGERMRRWLG